MLWKKTHKLSNDRESKALPQFNAPRSELFALFVHIKVVQTKRLIQTENNADTCECSHQQMFQAMLLLRFIIQICLWIVFSCLFLNLASELSKMKHSISLSSLTIFLNSSKIVISYTKLEMVVFVAMKYASSFSTSNQSFFIWQHHTPSIK